ncbi:MAG: hypothetical protein AAFX79_00785 [Planctomycetota bacterium]
MLTPDEFVLEVPASVRTRAASLRRLVLDLAPFAAERVTWDAISFYDPRRGGPIKGSICQLVHRRGVLRLDFPLGEFMDDPEHVLSSEGGRRGKRFVALGESWPDDRTVESLIRAALAAPPKPKRLPAPPKPGD